MATPKTNNFTYGKGEVHFSLFKPGTFIPAGFRYIGNTPQFGWQTAIQELDHFGSDHGVGELDFSIQTQVTRSGTLVTDNVDLDNIALNFLGTRATVAQTATTANTETFVDVLAGMSYQVGMTVARPAGVRLISNVTVKVGAVSKVLGTDYTVDAQRGMIYIIPGGSIVSGTDDIIVTYDTVLSSYAQTISGHNAIEGAIMFIADNPAGDNIDYFVPRARLSPNGEFALKAENALQALNFNLKVIKRDSTTEAIYANGQPVAG